MTTDREYKSILEGLLYVWGDPLPLADIAKLLSLSVKDVRRLSEELQAEMEHERRGLVLRFLDDAVQLTTRKEHAAYFEQLFGETKNRRLSNSARETLAIIAYKQPVTRVEIDAIRGVRSESALDTLLERDLIEEAGRLEQIGRPILYRTTKAFLRAFSLSSLDELPSRAEVEAMWEKSDAD
ncbi:SMC-Scp complex subunit ScpB [Murdochiella massiliensis]|uniref:SMC-Scp complex subunit ScpB n=1 Tax=Murdochiella massiliensis TaxID=1673723 RepID=UPI00082BC7CB|nr:SMC-Scp complex subunit ScpB [Murdochiella massiliensis]